MPKQMGMKVFIDTECTGSATEYILQASLRDTFATLCYKKCSPVMIGLIKILFQGFTEDFWHNDGSVLFSFFSDPEEAGNNINVGDIQRNDRSCAKTQKAKHHNDDKISNSNK